MILTKSEPFTLDEIDQLKEQFEVSIKTVKELTQYFFQKIAREIETAGTESFTDENIERYLLFGVLLQNYTLHNQ